MTSAAMVAPFPEIGLQSSDVGLNRTAMPIERSSCELSIGVIVLPRFTMLALSALLDTLRLAADEADGSRPIRCSWTVMTSDGRPVRASNGIALEPTHALVDPTRFDYVAVVAGLLTEEDDNPKVHAYLQRAAKLGMPLIGICTGSFVLARAGLMDGYHACVSWLHREQLARAHPKVHVVGDMLYVADRNRITCAGGTSVIHLASHLIETHLGAGSADKGLRIMLEERRRDGWSTQPPPRFTGSSMPSDSRVRRAMLEIERQIDGRVKIGQIDGLLGLSARQLRRLFVAQVGCSPSAYAQSLRLERARRLVRESQASLTEIANVCGYSDAAHLSRSYRARYATSPSRDRLQNAGS